MCVKPRESKCEPIAFTSKRAESILRLVKSTDLQHSPIPLAQLRRGESAVVSGLDAAQTFGDSSSDTAALLARLRDLGFVAGTRCEIVARMWLGGDPLVVRIGGSTFALRRAEAAAVQVLRQQQRPSPSAVLVAKDASAATV
jgi:Fe2+ transport system protein FeoA